MNKLVYIVIVNWNGKEDSIQCLESVYRLNYPDFRVVLVDNASIDNSVDAIQSRFPEIIVINTGENLGYAGGNNAGIRYALEAGADYIWLLNNDTVVDKDCLHFMVETAETSALIGMVGNKIYYFHAPDTIWFAGGRVNLMAGGLTEHIGKDCKVTDSLDSPSATEYVTGCSILVKRELVVDVGLLDESYFLYFEDVDWSLRARQKGWKLQYEPKAKLWHKEGAQTDYIYSSKFIYYTLRNRLYLMNKFAPDRMLRCHLLQIRMALYFLKSACCHGITHVLKIFKLTVTSYIDFYLFNRMGINKAL